MTHSSSRIRLQSAGEDSPAPHIKYKSEGRQKQRGALKAIRALKNGGRNPQKGGEKRKMEQTDIDTSIYEEVVKGYSGFGLGELAHIARQVETELDAWIVEFEKEKGEKY